MDILFIEQAPEGYRELSQEVSLLTHDKYFGDGNRVWVHGVKTPQDLIGALRCAMRDCVLEDNFIISRDTTFITGEFMASLPHCNRKSLHLKRKGAETDAMVASLRHLMENGCPTFDYEIQVPHIFNKALLKSRLEELSELPFQHVHTTYFNRLNVEPILMDSPLIEQWLWHHVPPGPVTTLGPECFDHKDCQRWLKGLKHAAAQHA